MVETVCTSGGLSMITSKFFGDEWIGGREGKGGIRMGTAQGLQEILAQLLHAEFSAIPVLGAPAELTEILCLPFRAS